MPANLPPDYHMHTPLCRHAVGEPVEYAAQAANAGVKEIGFSDHNPMAEDDFDEWRMFLGDLDTYVANVERARKEFPQIRILLAMEVDYIPGFEDWIRKLATRHPWDYFIGSVHYVNDAWDIDNPAKVAEWKKREPFEVWELYFERLTRAAQSGLFEIIGHADLCKKFCFYPREDPAALYAGFLDAVREWNVAIELNTAGLRKDCREIYPSERLLRMAFERNVPITFGSDAHAPGEVGADFVQAVELARNVGYRSSCRFRNRQREIVAF
jgi:histidinol-phosphatase (PHP family)